MSYTLPTKYKLVLLRTLQVIVGFLLLYNIVVYSPFKPSFHSVSSIREKEHLGSLIYYVSEVLLQFWGVGAYLFSLFFLLTPLMSAQASSKKHLWLRAGALITSITLYSYWLMGGYNIITILKKVEPIRVYIENLPSTVGGFFGYKLHDSITEVIPFKMAPYYFALEDLLLLYTFSILYIFALGKSWKDSIKLVHSAITSTLKGVAVGLNALYIALKQSVIYLQSKLSRTEKTHKKPYPDTELENAPVPPVDKKQPITPKQASSLVLSPTTPEPDKTHEKPKETTSRTIEAPNGYAFPHIDMLNKGVQKVESFSDEELNVLAEKLRSVLKEFGVKGDIIGARPGPVVTLFELEPAPGVKSSRVIGLADDIARSMSAHAARVSVIPGRNAIGIELPNEIRETVYLRDILASPVYEGSTGKLPLALGKDISGKPIIADLAKMPHLLVAGTTGSGKSVGINAMILSLLYKHTPETCRFIMIDPKMLELSVYEGIPHLLSPVVTNPKKAVVALKWVVKEMEDRYMAMSQIGVRNMDGFNQRLKEAEKNRETLTRRVQTGFDPETGLPLYEEQPLNLKPLPNIVVVVDEMADLMLVAGKDIEAAIQRLAQMARAAGIHLIMATQRPSVDVITGTIKANFPTRISFMVTSKIDSRTILGEQGAEQLLGQGDMLYMASGGKLKRVHGPFVSDKEVEKIVNALKKNAAPEYISLEVNDDDTAPTNEMAGLSLGIGDEGNDLYEQAVKVIIQEGRVSTSFIQRQLGIGYNRAANLVEKMEKEGIISAPNRTGKREILIKK